MTQKYYGSKVVTAWKAEKDGEQGYGVKYEDGYTSWSPRLTFEAAYIPMGHTDSLPGWQERIVAEYIQLRDRSNKLQAYLDSQELEQTIDSVALDLIEEQAAIMLQYLEVLDLRMGLHGIAKIWVDPTLVQS
jgi:hypothetical protein